MAAAELSYAVAAGAGALSFLSPCVLPLVPGYLCFVAGTTLDELAAEQADRHLARRALIASLVFVLGFATVFVALGASASAVSRFLLRQQFWIGWAAGAVIVVFGLHYMGLFRIALLNRELRFSPAIRPPGTKGPGLLSAYLIGLAFAFGWTPCIGPILATILTIAGSQDSLGYGIALLSVYALGLGIPFLLAAYAINPFLAFMRHFRRHLRKVEIAAGALMVATGVLIAAGDLGRFSYYLLEAFPILSRIG